MDALDIGSIRTMGIRPFARWPREASGIRPATIAKEPGASQQTIRDRLVRLEAAGVIRGHHLLPNLRRVGLAIDSVHRELEYAPDDETLNRLRAVDGVVTALRFYGPTSVSTSVTRCVTNIAGGRRTSDTSPVARIACCGSTSSRSPMSVGT